MCLLKDDPKLFGVAGQSYVYVTFPYSLKNLEVVVLITVLAFLKYYPCVVPPNESGLKTCGLRQQQKEFPGFSP